MFRMRYFPNAATCFHRLRSVTVWFSLLRSKIPKTYCMSIFRTQRGKEGFTTKISSRSVELWRLFLHIYISGLVSVGRRRAYCITSAKLSFKSISSGICLFVSV